MAISQDIWDKAKALFMTGDSLSKIATVTGISKGAIGKKANKEGWNKETITTLVNAEVTNIIYAKTIRDEKRQLNETERDTYNKEFISLSHSLGLFQNSTQKNQQAINKIQEDILKDASREDLFDLATISKITETNRKQLFGITEAFKESVVEDTDNTVQFKRLANANS